MAAATGGTTFDGSKKLDDHFDRMEEELRNQYSLGFKPDPLPRKGEFRAIRLTTRRSGLTLRTRKGYFAV
jgi:VWFA-related protein